MKTTITTQAFFWEIKRYVLPCAIFDLVAVVQLWFTTRAGVNDQEQVVTRPKMKTADAKAVRVGNLRG